MAAKPATLTIQRDAQAFAGVLLEELERIGGFAELRHALAEGVLRLLDEITLAVSRIRGRRRALPATTMTSG